MLKVIDLFCGCGGLSLGFEQAGYFVTDAVEYDKTICDSYRHNHPKTNLINDDIKNVDNSKYFTEHCADVIIGGPPCQGFSMAGARIRKNGFLTDPRNYLFLHYFNIVKIVRPKVFVIENVKGILNLDGGEIFKEINKVFTDPENFDGHPYYLSYKIFKTKDLGIPEKRERVVIFGTTKQIDLEKEYNNAMKRIIKKYPSFFENVSVWDAISDLPDPTDDGVISGLICKTKYQEYLSNNGNTFNHAIKNHTLKTIGRMEKVKIGENFTSLNEDIKSVHSGSYGRLDPNSFAPTITTRFDTPSGGRFTHPYQNRTITQREAARIQSFPDSFEFLGTKTSINKQIGNAVPPKMAYFVAELVRGILDENIL